LIGINSQILSPSGGSIGLGFAIPSNMARTVLEQLINSGKVRRGQLGIVVLKIPSEEASKLGVTQGPGVVVYQVQSGSGADRAGLRQGDIITALNGTQINDPNTFRNLIAGIAPGTEVNLTVKRDGSERQVHATLGEFTPEAERPRDE
jgi:S1-C subfamily serine protease